MAKQKRQPSQKDRPDKYLKGYGYYNKLPEKITKLATVLNDMNIPQNELHHLIFERTGYVIGTDRINKMVRGKQPHVMLKTMVIIAETLGVPVDEIIDKEELLKPAI